MFRALARSCPWTLFALGQRRKLSIPGRRCSSGTPHIVASTSYSCWTPRATYSSPPTLAVGVGFLRSNGLIPPVWRPAWPDVYSGMLQSAITFVGSTYQSPTGASAMASLYRLAIIFCIIAPAGMMTLPLGATGFCRRCLSICTCTRGHLHPALVKVLDDVVGLWELALEVLRCFRWRSSSQLDWQASALVACTGRTPLSPRRVRARSSWPTSSRCYHAWNMGSCHLMLMHPGGQLPGALGNCPTPNLNYQCLHLGLCCWGTAQCHFPALSGMWLSLKKRAKGWQGRLEGLKNSHGPSKVQKLPKK